MPRILISYRREDTSGHAGRLYDRLAAQFGQKQVFMDIADIRPGEDYFGVIRDAVSGCDVVLALIGPRWVSCTKSDGSRRLDDPTDLVRFEVETALQRGIRVVPVLVQGATMPRSEELPSALARLARRNAVELSDARFNHDVSRLAEVARATSSWSDIFWPAVRLRSLRARAAISVAAASILIVGGWLTIGFLARERGDDPDLERAGLGASPPKVNGSIDRVGQPPTTAPPQRGIDDALILKAVTAGSHHTCGVGLNGEGYCWGKNGDGELGDGSRDDRTTPGLVSGKLKWETISINDDHACGIDTRGDAYCWGKNNAGQLGDSTRESRRTPDLVSGNLSWKSLSAGEARTCALTRDNDVYCWGENPRPDAPGASSTPVELASGLKFTDVSVGEDHTCGITVSERAYCWGPNSQGQLGDGYGNGKYYEDGPPSSRPEPNPVSSDERFVSLSAGRDHTCGVTALGVAYCWGDNTFGQLGDGSTTNRSLPVRVVGGEGFRTVHSGDDFTCALDTRSSVQCWGHSLLSSSIEGGLEGEDRRTPGRLLGGLQFVSISAGATHACGVTPQGATYCWGWEPDGEFGDGDDFPPPIPALVIK